MRRGSPPSRIDEPVVDAARLRVVAHHVSQHFGKAGRLATPRGLHEVLAYLGLHRTEEVGRAAPHIFVVRPGGPSRAH